MPDSRRPFTWRCRERQLSLGVDTVLMGIVNVTPDSFSDGGRFSRREDAIAQGLRLADEGALILDVGGESSRPGAAAVSAAEERERVVPVIAALAGRTDVLVSVDTTKAAVAAAALAAGAHIINDISALTADPGMAEVAATYRAGVVLMHMQGRPASMQDNPEYDDVVSEVRQYLQGRVTDLEAAGIDRDRLVVDPGIGFGKTLAHNLALLAGLPELAQIGVPLLVGLSRKRFIGELTGRDVDDRMAGSLAGLAYAVMQGVHIIRVHDVKESCDTKRMLDILRRKESERAEYPIH